MWSDLTAVVAADVALVKLRLKEFSFSEKDIKVKMNLSLKGFRDLILELHEIID